MNQAFSITNNAVSTHAGNMGASVGDLQANLQQFMAACEALPSVWRGGAFASWSRVQQQWAEASAQCQRALDDLSIRVDTAGKVYAAGDAEQSAAFDATNSGANWAGTQVRL